MELGWASEAVGRRGRGLTRAGGEVVDQRLVEVGRRRLEGAATCGGGTTVLGGGQRRRGKKQRAGSQARGTEGRSNGEGRSGGEGIELAG